jgi:hypothetical protein
MSNWDQPQCEQCWIERNSSVDGTTMSVRRPHVLLETQIEICAWCGKTTIMGVYVRADPASVPFPDGEQTTEPSAFYETDPANPDAPVSLKQYRNLHVGDSVVYENPAWKMDDGTYRTGGMDGPLVISAMFRFGDPYADDHVTAILNGGEWEVAADNLALKEEMGG